MDTNRSGSIVYTKIDPNIEPWPIFGAEVSSLRPSPLWFTTYYIKIL